MRNKNIDRLFRKGTQTILAVALLQGTVFCTGDTDDDTDSLTALLAINSMSSEESLQYAKPESYSCGEFTEGEKISSPPGIARTMLLGSPLPYALTSTSDPFTAGCSPASISTSGSTVNFTYDSNGLVATVTVDDAVTTTIKYDGPHGYVSSVAKVCDNSATGSYTTTFTYSGSNLTKEEKVTPADCVNTNPYGTPAYNESETTKTTTYEYSGDVLPSSITVQETGSDDIVTEYTYTKDGDHVTKITTVSGDVQSTEEYVYNSSDLLVTNSSGSEFTYEDNRVTEKDLNSGEYVYTYVYDDDLNISELSLALNTSYMTGTYVYEFSY